MFRKSFLIHACVVSSLLWLVVACKTMERVSRDGYSNPDIKDAGYDQPYSGSKFTGGGKYDQNNCPATPELIKKIQTDGFKSCANGNSVPKFNRSVLREAGQVPLGGGYSMKGRAVNVPSNACNTQVISGGGTSQCVGGGFLPLMRALDEDGYTKPVCDNNPAAAKKYFGTGGAMFTYVNNDHVQVGDLATSSLNLGDVVVNRPNAEAIEQRACPGDFISFGRVLTIRGEEGHYGHQGVFLGMVNGKMYWHSSQSRTNGWGIDCYPVAKMDSADFAITRISRPENIRDVPNLQRYRKGNAGRKFQAGPNLHVPGKTNYQDGRS